MTRFSLDYFARCLNTRLKLHIAIVPFFLLTTAVAFAQQPVVQPPAVEQQPVAQPYHQDPTTAPVTDKSNIAAAFTFHDRVRYYVKTTFSLSALPGPVVGSALGQWVTGSPPEWGQGFEGYGRRLASGYGRQVISNTLGFPIAMVAGEDPRHYPTGEHGVFRRAAFAAREAVVSHNASGGLMPAYSRIIGDYSAAFISNAWYPHAESNFTGAMRRGSTALASDIVQQEIKEFWPDVRRKFHRDR